MGILTDLYKPSLALLTDLYELTMAYGYWKSGVSGTSAKEAVFHLHFRYNATGPADHISSELVYCALQRAGLADAEAAGLGLAFYAFVLGFALAEAEGLLRPLGQSEEAELEALEWDDFDLDRGMAR